MFKYHETVLSLEICGTTIDLQCRVTYIFHPFSPGFRETLGVPIEPDNEPVVDVHKIEAQTPDGKLWLDVTRMFSDEAIQGISEEILTEEAA
jgi:hypothetical protein